MKERSRARFLRFAKEEYESQAFQAVGSTEFEFAFWQALILIALRFKNPEFSGEKEWRLLKARGRETVSGDEKCAVDPTSQEKICTNFTADSLSRLLIGCATSECDFVKLNEAAQPYSLAIERRSGQEVHR